MKTQSRSRPPPGSPGDVGAGRPGATRRGTTVGREGDLEAIAAFLHGDAGRSRVLVLEGDAGAGKTTVWEEAVAAAGAAGFRVLTSRPLPVESRITYAAADDLLTGVLDEALEALPAPQRHALETALLLVEPGARAPEPQAIAFAFLSALRALGRGRPTLVAIDDIQWLDDASAGVVAYAARRVRDEPIWLMFASRTGGVPPTIGARTSLIGGLRPERIPIGPLSLGAIQHIVREQLGQGLSRPMLHRVHEASGGNPFHALEIARALSGRGNELSPGEPLPFSAELHDLVGERLAPLPPATLRALEMAALSSEPTLALLERALREPADLSAAVDSNLVTLGGGRVSFSHPIFPSWIAGQMTGQRRADVHRCLGNLAVDREERAHHLALGSTEPDAEVARELELAAAMARTRGAPSVSASFLDHALRLTPPGTSVLRPTVAAADAHFEAGDTVCARARLQSLADGLAPGGERAEVLWRLAIVRSESDDPAVWVELAEQALEELEDDAPLEVGIHCELAWAALFVNDLPKALVHARKAVGLSDRLDDADVVAQALASLAYMELTAGLPLRIELIDRALATERVASHIRIDRSPSLIRGFQLLLTGELEAARERFEYVQQVALDRGNESYLSVTCGALAILETLAGNWQLAASHSREALALAEETGVNWHEATYAGAILDAHLGRVGAAVCSGEQLLLHTGDGEIALYALRSLAVLGFVDLSLGDCAAACVRLGRASDLAFELGIGEPGLLRFVPDHVEALVGLGRLGEAEALLERFATLGRRTGHCWALATVDRCRGLIRAAGDDLPGGLADLERARDAFAQLPFVFEYARTLMALGIVQRRALRRGQARTSLESALEIFEQLPAPIWADRVRAELGRIGGRTSSGRELTAQEQRISELVAGGATNREVAAALFITVNTVEGALTRVYRKLGIRSRTELANRLAEAVPKL